MNTRFDMHCSPATTLGLAGAYSDGQAAPDAGGDWIVARTYGGPGQH